MAVSNGQKANSTNFNNAFASKQLDNTMEGKQELANTDAASGVAVSNTQREFNGINSTLDDTSQVNQAQDRKPTWASDNIGSPNQAHKQRIDAVQQAVEVNQGEVEALRQTTGTTTTDTDMGAYTPGSNGFSITDNEPTKTNIQELVDGVDGRIPESDKGVADGVATLDSGGRIPSSQLPTTASEYLGAWDANTNSPALIDGTGTNGDFYRVSVAGTQDLGSGSESYETGDVVIYNGSIWQKIPAEAAVTSVNGQTGVVVLDSDDIAEGSTNLYYDDALVSANADVVANTAKVSADGSIDTHSDVDTTTTPPALGEALVWDGSNFVPGAVASSGGGSRLRNIFSESDSDFESGVASWTQGADITIAQTTMAGEILVGTASGKILKSAVNASGQFVALQSQTIEPADRGAMLRGEFEFNPLSGYAEGDLEVEVFDDTNAAVLPISIFVISNAKYRVNYDIQLASNTAQVTVRLKVANANTNAFDVVIDTFKGLSVEPNQTFTSSFSSNVSPPSAGTFITLTSVDVPPGLWDINYVVRGQRINTVSSSTLFRSVASLNPANGTAINSFLTDDSTIAFPGGSGPSDLFFAGAGRVFFAVQTTVYLNGTIFNPVDGRYQSGSIEAKRVVR